jgi:hypothetical protein
MWTHPFLVLSHLLNFYIRNIVNSFKLSIWVIFSKYSSILEFTTVIKAQIIISWRNKFSGIWWYYRPTLKKMKNNLFFMTDMISLWWYSSKCNFNLYTWSRWLISAWLLVILTFTVPNLKTGSTKDTIARVTHWTISLSC